MTLEIKEPPEQMQTLLQDLDSNAARVLHKIREVEPAIPVAIDALVSVECAQEPHEHKGRRIPVVSITLHFCPQAERETIGSCLIHRRLEAAAVAAAFESFEAMIEGKDRVKN